MTERFRDREYQQSVGLTDAERIADLEADVRFLHEMLAMMVDAESARLRLFLERGGK